MQAIGEEANEDVRFDAALLLMMDRTDRQVALEVPKRLFDLGKLDIILPQLGRVVRGQVAAQQVAALATIDTAILLAIDPPVECLSVDGFVGSR